MKKTTLPILCLLLLLLLGVNVNAAISPRIYNSLNDFQEKISAASIESDFAAIERDLLKLKYDLKGNSLGSALTLQLLAQLKDLQGKPSDSLLYLEEAHGLPSLDESTKSQVGLSLAYMYFTQEQFENSIVILKEHVGRSNKKPSANVLALLAMAYFSLDQYKEGLPFIELACELSKTPNESWLANAFAANYKLNNYKRALKYTNDLVLNFPHKADYWHQKIGLHQSMEKYKDAAVASNASHSQGYLMKESQMYNLGVLMASEGAPYEVARTISSAITEKKLTKTEKISRLLMQAWVQSREMKSARAEMKSLFELYGKVKDGVLLSNYQMDAELWSEAIKTSGDLLSRKHVDSLTDKQKGAVLLIRGVSQFNQGQIKAALVSMGKASSIKSVSSQAKSWMTYINQMQG